MASSGTGLHGKRFVLRGTQPPPPAAALLEVDALCSEVLGAKGSKQQLGETLASTAGWWGQRGAPSHWQEDAEEEEREEGEVSPPGRKRRRLAGGSGGHAELAVAQRGYVLAAVAELQVRSFCTALCLLALSWQWWSLAGAMASTFWEHSHLPAHAHRLRPSVLLSPRERSLSVVPVGRMPTTG